MLFLNGKDIGATVIKVVLVEQMKKAMHVAESGKAVPPRSYVSFGNNCLGLMPLSPKKELYMPLPNTLS